MEQVSANVVSNSEIAQEMLLLVMEAPLIAAAGMAGQFVMVAIPGDETFLRRPFALHTIDAVAGRFSIVYHRAGVGTNALARFVQGDTLDILGPLGIPVSVPAEAEHVVLVAGGIGIASLVGIAENAIAADKAVTLLHGARTNYVMYPGRLLPAGVRELTATEDGSAGLRGFVTHLLLQEQEHADWIVACGPTPMFHSLARMRQEGNLTKPVTALLEVRMGCGFGFCYGCTTMTGDGAKLVCKDGPAFQLESIDWDGPIAPVVHRV